MYVKTFSLHRLRHLCLFFIGLPSQPSGIEMRKQVVYKGRIALVSCGGIDGVSQEDLFLSQKTLPTSVPLVGYLAWCHLPPCCCCTRACWGGPLPWHSSRCLTNEMVEAKVNRRLRVCRLSIIFPFGCLPLVML